MGLWKLGTYTKLLLLMFVFVSSTGPFLIFVKSGKLLSPDKSKNIHLFHKAILYQTSRAIERQNEKD